MTQPSDSSSVPQAKVLPKRRLPWAWLLPIVGLGVIAYFAYWANTRTRENVEVRVADAMGIKAFQTPVLCQGVQVGRVTAIKLDPLAEGAIVQVRLAPSALSLAADGAEWWVVRPELGLTDVSGLEALLSGPSLVFRPGKGEHVDFFEALPAPPVDEGRRGGLPIQLTAADRMGINPGSPIRYRGVPVGRVINLRLQSDGKAVVFQVEIDRPYAHLVRDNSVFWNSGGIRGKLDLGLGGGEIDLPPLHNILDAGIALATPSQPGLILDHASVFPLLDSPPEDHHDWTPDLRTDAFGLPSAEAEAANDADAKANERDRPNLDLISPHHRR